MTWAIRQRVEPVTRLVLLALADRADKQGLAYPSVGWLAEFVGVHRSTILRELKRLVGRCLIEDSGQRKGLTHQVKVWRLRMTEAGLPFEEPRRGKSRSIGDTLPVMKLLQDCETVSPSGKGSTMRNGRPRRPVAPNAGKGRTGATRNKLEPEKEKRDALPQMRRRVFDVGADWQPPQLPDGSALRQLVEHWTPDELGKQVDQFRQRAKVEGVNADLTVAWQAHVWRVEMEGGQ